MGTAAYKLDGQLPENIKQERVKKLYNLQKKISAEKLKKFVGKSISVVADGIDYEKEIFYGRAYFSAPDIDGKVYFTSTEEVEQGRRYNVHILKSDEYDLYGEVTQ